MNENKMDNNKNKEYYKENFIKQCMELEMKGKIRNLNLCTI